MMRHEPTGGGSRSRWFAIGRTGSATDTARKTAPGGGRLADRMASARRLMTASPLGLAVALVGIFVAVGAIAGSVVADAVTGLVTRQIVETITAEAAGLQDLDRVAGLAAVKAAVDTRSASRPTADGPRTLYLLVDGAGLRLAGTLAPSTLGNRSGDGAAVGDTGGMFRVTIVGTAPDAASASASASARWAVGVPVQLTFGVRLLVARDVGDVRRFAEQLRWSLIAALGSIAAVGIGLGVVSSRQVLARIETVTQTTDRIMAGDLTRRIPVTGAGDEVDDLSARLNLMLDRIEQLLSGMQEISDNIAHDLKTPLSRLRNRAEAALRDPAGANAHRDGLERTIEAADEIITTFNALLLIARLEAGAVPESFTTFDVADLVRDVAELYAPVVEEAGAAFVVDVAASVMVTGNRQLIGQAVANLLDNAIKYGAIKYGAIEYGAIEYGTSQTSASGRSVDADMMAPAGRRAEISVSLRQTAADVVVTIADRGPGIPVADRVKVQRRFVRLDASRTAPGTGLGLSLVAAVARLHAGHLTLGDNAPGLSVELAIPRYPSRAPPTAIDAPLGYGGAA